MQRYFIEQELHQVGIEVPVSQEQIHHMSKVMRMKAGECCEIVDCKEQLWIAKVEEVQPFILKSVEKKEQQVELPIFVTIYVGLSKGDKLEWIVQKATELGVDTIVPVQMKRNMVKWTADKSTKKIDRLQKIATEAAEQAHRLHIPQVKPLHSLEEAINDASKKTQALVAFEEVAKAGEHAQFFRTLRQLKPQDSLAFFFGPEGGLEEEEIKQMRKCGILPCALGPRILRAETAPLYALSAISYHFELLSD